MAKTVSIFVTCIVDQVFPRVGLAMADVLERVGWQVDFRPEQTCCGQPAFNSGYRTEARAVARRFIDVFADAEHIVVPSGSCTSMISHHMAELFEPGSREHDAALNLHHRVWEFSRFLIDVANSPDVGARLDAVATYHDSCHALRELKLKSPPRQLLKHVRGLELVEMDAAEECCGFGGTFSVKFGDLSAAMARTKINSIQKTGASVVISVDSSCLMQLQGVMDRDKIPVRTMHLSEVLASR
ncbi:MAG TPA: (Fe-S)-binding protein [Bryobacteraceae bacterium]|jgi:L-lactate dehydrogenase complex protein LldE|nr:(Fe-S)-binding protein [Bryobacteraceae bacterium]